MGAAGDMNAIPGLLVGLLLVSFSGEALALVPDLNLRQLNHRVFTVMEGAPSDIDAIAQGADGTLWIGGRAGLTRFDGMRFVPYPAPADEPLQSTNVSSLFAAPDGALWIGFRPGGVSVLKGGHVTHYGERDGLPDGTVQQFALDRDGSLWAAARSGLARLKNNRWEKITSEPGMGAPYGVLVDRAGTLWVATVRGLFARPAAENRFHQIDGRRYFGPGGLILAQGPDGIIWAASDHELVRVESAADARSAVITVVRQGSLSPLLVNDRGELWASDRQAQTLIRVPLREPSTQSSSSPHDHPDGFARSDGLSSGRVFALMEDREQNIWVGTSTGLHRFAYTNVVRDVAPPCSQGIFTGAAFAAGESGALWVACNDGSAGHVDELRDGRVMTRLPSPPFTVAHRDLQGVVWFGGPIALGHLEDNQMVTMPVPEQVRGRPVEALVRDTSGALWVSVSRIGVFRVANGEWSEYGGLEALPRAIAHVATADTNGAVWLGYSNNRIARVNQGVAKVFDTRDGLAVGNVLAILARSGQVWVGGELGFARLEGERFVSVESASGTPLRGISGIVKASNGDFWLNGIGGIVHIPRQEIERVVREPSHAVQLEMFDYLDGLLGTAVQLRPQPSAIETSDGKIWFSMTAGIVAVDAAHLVRNTLPPPVTIWSLGSGGSRYSNVGSALVLPVHSTDAQIEYTAGSLTLPERVRFRYRLDGLDDKWQDAGARREARYTNLGPGRYTFRVIASNNDQVWNNVGASMAFTILPAFYQTWWFYVLCGLVAVGILAALYRVRMHQVAAQVRGRLEARLAERERIARDLHDTLLQGVQGLIWRFQAAADRISGDEPARQLLEQALDRADQLLGESRDKVQDLRPAASKHADLAQALAAEGEQFAQLHPARFRMSVQGSSRELHPIVREEGFLIGREALANAFRHSAARNIEAEVTYGDRCLQLRIRDDGRGIGGTVLDAGGRPGHFGLVGMRERAKRLGGNLDVWSKPGAGTEVDLRVPAQVAYTKQRNGTRRMRRVGAIS